MYYVVEPIPHIVIKLHLAVISVGIWQNMTLVCRIEPVVNNTSGVPPPPCWYYTQA